MKECDKSGLPKVDCKRAVLVGTALVQWPTGVDLS